jgi:carbon-monoxide dehydrogenase iron sulfur subunit
MTTMRIDVSIAQCTGCRACQTACSFHHTERYDPAVSRIQVLSQHGFCLSLPIVCMHCDDAPCVGACGEGALYREERLGTIVVDEEKCVGCRLCVEACPYGAMLFDDIRNVAILCDSFVASSQAEIKAMLERLIGSQPWLLKA